MQQRQWLRMLLLGHAKVLLSRAHKRSRCAFFA
jgi:hypothetical protein